MEAKDEKRPLEMQRDLAAVEMLIVDKLGDVPLSPTGAELFFETFSQRHVRGLTIATSNLPFEDWTLILGSERLAGALLAPSTHPVIILAINSDSYQVRQSARVHRPGCPAFLRLIGGDVIPRLPASACALIEERGVGLARRRHRYVTYSQKTLATSCRSRRRAWW